MHVILINQDCALNLKYGKIKFKKHNFLSKTPGKVQLQWNRQANINKT